MELANALPLVGPILPLPQKNIQVQGYQVD